MDDKYLIDTDIIIDYLRSESKAINFLEKTKNELLISAISVAELYSGIRNNKEQNIIEQFVSAFLFIPIDFEISMKGGLIRKEYGKAYGIGLGDSIIAATSIYTNSKLVSLNYKHFQMFENLIVPYRK